LLAMHHIRTPDLPEPRLQTPSSGKSKLKAWICGCKPRPIHVQVAVKDFQACCLKCGELFRQKRGES
jgi:hypothetical protein